MKLCESYEAQKELEQQLAAKEGENAALLESHAQMAEQLDAVKLEFEKIHACLEAREGMLREKFADEIVWGAFLALFEEIR